MNIDRKYKYYDEGVLPEEGEYGVTYLTLYSSNAGNVYDGWIWDPDHKTIESAIERTFGFRNPDYPDYCYDDEVVVDLSNAQNREESSEFAQGRITSFNTNVSSSPIILEDIDITGLTEEERERKATTVLFSAIPLVDDSYIQAMVEVQCKVNISPDNTTGIVRVEAFYILNDESDRTMRPNPVHTFSVSSPNERHTLPWLYWNPALKHEDNNYIGVKLIATGGTVEIGISDDPDYGDAMITLTSAGLTGDNIFSGKPLYIELSGKEEAVAGYHLDIDDYKVLAYYDTGEVYDVTHMCEFVPEMGTELVDPITVLTAMYQGLEDSMVIYLATIAYIDIEGVDEFHGSMELELENYTVTAYFDSGDEVEVTSACAFDPNMGTVLTEDTTLTAYYIPVFDIINGWTDPIGRYGQGNIDLYNRPMYIQPDDGTISTVNSMSFNDEGLEVLIPTIGRDEKGNPIQMEDDEAIDYYYETGEYLGKFNTIQEADAYGEQLHLQQEYIYDIEKGYSCELDITAIPAFGSTFEIDEDPDKLIYTFYNDGHVTITGNVEVHDGHKTDPVTGTPLLDEVYYMTDVEKENPVYFHERIDVSSAANRLLTYKRQQGIIADDVPQIKQIVWDAEGSPMGIVLLCGKTMTNNPSSLVGFESIDTSMIGDVSKDPTNPRVQRLRGLSLKENIRLNDDSFKWLKNVDTSRIVDMSETFKGCKYLTRLDFVSNWDVSNVTNMRYMFGCSSLSNEYEEADLREPDMYLEHINGFRKWNVSNVEDMSYMFDYCSHLEYLTPMYSWRTPKGVNCSYMFAACKGLVGTAGIGNITPTSVAYMFYNCEKLTHANGLASLDTSRVTNMGDMFSKSGLGDLTGLSGWDVSHVTSFANMFANTKVVNPAPISDWNVHSATSFAGMFAKNVADWETDYVIGAVALESFNTKVTITQQSAGLDGTPLPFKTEETEDYIYTYYRPARSSMLLGTDVFRQVQRKNSQEEPYWEFMHELPNWYKSLILNNVNN